MAITYAVYKVEPGGFATEPLTTGIAPDLETATRQVAKQQFRNKSPQTQVIDDITATITVNNPQYARYKVVVLKKDA
jgi:hypothetical protein